MITINCGTPPTVQELREWVWTALATPAEAPGTPEHAKGGETSLAGANPHSPGCDIPVAALVQIQGRKSQLRAGWGHCPGPLWHWLPQQGQSLCAGINHISSPPNAGS